MKARITLLICVLCATALLSACGQTSTAPEVTPDPAGTAYQKITAEDGKALLESDAVFTLVDVRRADEYETAHIPSAINVPNESIDTVQPDALPDLNQTLIVYCRTGVRSKQASDKLVAMGYTDVRDMGGIVDWPYDTITGSEAGVYGETVSESDTATPEAVYQKITAEEGKELLDSDAILTLVDVRDADEYASGHIPGAINIANEVIGSTPPDALPNLNQTVIVYCQGGGRSSQAANKLLKMGYTDVLDMGGIDDWPYDTVTGTEPGVYPGREDNSNTSPSGLMSNFSAKDLDGNDIDQSLFTGYELTMVNVWATYCGPCLSEMPELGDLADEYESKGVRIVGMVSDVLNPDGTVNDSQLETARSIIAETDADYIHIVPSEDLYGLLSQITAVPTTFFVDSNGSQVGNAFLGSRSKAEWNEIILKTLE